MKILGLCPLSLCWLVYKLDSLLGIHQRRDDDIPETRIQSTGRQQQHTRRQRTSRSGKKERAWRVVHRSGPNQPLARRLHRTI